MSCTYGFGKCDCERPECITARAIRRAAAEACRAAIVREFGSSSAGDYEGAPHLSEFPSREWVCRAFPWRSDRPCPSCGYVPHRLPAWATAGRVFVLAGQAFRIVTTGSMSYAGNGLHSEDHVHVEPLKGEAWRFPDTPVAVDVVQQALTQLFALPTFRVPELTSALFTLD